MSAMEQLRGMGNRELGEKLSSLRKELYEHRALAAAGKLDKPSRLRELRKEIARTLTVKHEREREERTLSA